MREVKTRKSIKKEDYEDLIYYKFKNSKFKQQTLPAWRPVPTMCSIIIVYLTFGVIFISISIVLLLFSRDVVKLEIPYNDECKDQEICKISKKIEKDMTPPIMVYYRLDGFFQNHRRYVKSKSTKQLYGDPPTLEEILDGKNCYPVVTNEDMRLKSNKSLNGDELNMDDVAVPCGLMAKTFFNDSFRNWTINNEGFIPDETNIAWPKDKHFFKNSNTSKQWIDIEDEHFIVWMRPSGLPNVIKLWARIDRELKKGQTLSFEVINNYNVTHYAGDKKIILTTINKLGGKNTFLGFSYFVVGIISLVLGIAFPLVYYQTHKNDKMKKK
jgi:hypothetical protein